VADRVDSVLAEWEERRPDLDTSALAVVSRILRAARLLQAELDSIAASYGLSHQGDLDALMELYRADLARGLTPTELAEALLLTGGGMTVRLHRLQKAGLVDRHPNPQDRRGVLVRLTPTGVDLVEHGLPTVVGAQTNRVDVLNSTGRRRLADLLRTVLEGLGDIPPVRPPDLIVRDET
jgi:DNA-binding MarR family transcriptional regulator